MFGRGRTNIRAMIEDQYDILSQMTSDIADHYQEETCSFENDICKVADENSDGDVDIRNSILESFDYQIERQYNLIYEARKILFCSFFSYLETMLYGIIHYYNIDRGEEKQVKQLINKIIASYKDRYGENLVMPENIKRNICDNYRLLRNFYMHGEINSKDRDRLKNNFRDTNLLISSENFEIVDNEFLRNVLDDVKIFLICIEDAYAMKIVPTMSKNLK